MQLDRNGLEILDRDECLRLLALATLGRIGFTSGALPTVLPVNFHLDRERILVHTARGGRLDAALKNAVVAFEADEFDPDRSLRVERGRHGRGHRASSAAETVSRALGAGGGWSSGCDLDAKSCQVGASATGVAARDLPLQDRPCGLAGS